MRDHYLLPALLGGLGLALLASLPSPAGEAADAEKINKLIEQMGSGTFAEREKATKELDAIGEPALAALRKAARSEDAEIKRRAQELLTKIEKRAENEKILAAMRVHLVYKDTPLGQAIADFQQKSGYPIHLHDPEETLKERKVTLDTGATTFWHALALFCDKAGLVETTMQDVMQPRNGPLPNRKPPAGQPPAPGKPPAAPGKIIELNFQPAQEGDVKTLPPVLEVGPGGGALIPGRGLRILPDSAGLILLKDGKPPKLPTDDSSAVRVRALPKADGLPLAEDGEILLVLEAAPEPKLQWQSLQTVHIEKALDDQGQNLKQIIPQVPAAPGFPGGAPPGRLRPAIGRPVGLWGGVYPQVPVHFKKAEKASRSLKELRGVLTAGVLSEPKPMIAADNLAKAVGKTFKGKEGGSIKILEVKTDKNKSTTIQFEFEQPPLENVVPFTGVPGINAVMPRRMQPPLPLRPVQPPPPAPAPGGPALAAQPAVQVQVQVQAAGPVFMAPINGLSVRDGKGNTIPVQMRSQLRMVAQAAGGNVLTATYTLICQPGKDQGEPARLVYLGRKRVTLDIPFALKDVPLP